MTNQTQPCKYCGKPVHPQNEVDIAVGIMTDWGDLICEDCAEIHKDDPRDIFDPTKPPF